MLLWLIMKVKLEPFVALLVAGFAVARIGGIPATEIVGTTQRSETVGLVKKGVGGILGSIAVVVGRGSMLGSRHRAAPKPSPGAPSAASAKTAPRSRWG